MERRVMEDDHYLTIALYFFPAISLSFRPDGEVLAVTTSNGEISFWDVSRYVLARCS